jgi:putative phosphoribosyl transferase
MFVDRVDAGRQLAGRLRVWRDEHPVVIGLPRGGVPVAAEVAAAFGAPLDVIVAAKVGLPGQPELAAAAISEDGVRVVNSEIVDAAGLTDTGLSLLEDRTAGKVCVAVERMRSLRPPVPLRDRTVIIVDDGIATGATAAAACRVARGRGAARVILAAPVIAADALPMLRREADKIVSVVTPRAMRAVGCWYDDFDATTDEQVRTVLSDAIHGVLPGDRPVLVDGGGVRLHGRVGIPAIAGGLVVFAHGSGSSAHSPRNLQVADALRRSGLTTLLFDLLTPTEADDRRNVFDVELLAARLAAATSWACGQPWGRGQPVGWFGASTGAAAALIAAADPAATVSAVVSRGGRPDLAGPRLSAVRAPTLLIVGGADTQILALNRTAQKRLTCVSQLSVVPQATHLFEEPGTLDAAAGLARDWFLQHLAVVQAKTA